MSRVVNGTVWKTLADPEQKRLFLEIRFHDRKQVSFSALNLVSSEWLWTDFTVEEPWWVTLAAASGNILFLTAYTDSQNPDKKTLLAYDIQTRKLAWWKNEFAISTVAGEIVTGVETKFGSREIGLSVQTGAPIRKDAFVFGVEQNFKVIQPFHYHEGSSHFETVKSFLEKKANISPVVTIEYVEYKSLIVISAFKGKEDLANYLFVFNSGGDLVLKETLGEHLTGIALDTFFVLPSYLIFVKNKKELICYRIYD